MGSLSQFVVHHRLAAVLLGAPGTGLGAGHDVAVARTPWALRLALGRTGNLRICAVEIVALLK